MAEAGSPNKLKHLDYLQAVIARMAQNSFLFKGWAVTLASGLSAYGVTKSDRLVLLMPIVTTLLFWGLDGYYLWLERAFVKLYDRVTQMTEAEIDFAMRPDKDAAFSRWLRTCLRPHLMALYGTMIFVLVIGTCKVRSGG